MKKFSYPFGLIIFLIIYFYNISSGQDLNYSIRLLYSGDYQVGDPIYQKMCGNYLKELPFTESFWEDVCNKVQMEPPRRGPSWLFDGKYGQPYPVDCYVWGFGFDTVAVPNNQDSLEYLTTNPRDISQVVWYKGRFKSWKIDGSVRRNKEYKSTYPSEWNTWILDGIYYPDQKMHKVNEIGEFRYAVDYTLYPAKITRLFQNEFYVADHPGVGDIQLWGDEAVEAVFYANFIVQVVNNSPTYVVLSERTFNIQIRLSNSDICSSGFNGYARFGIGHITIPDWANPPD